MNIANIIILLSSVAGLSISLYFTLVSRHMLKPDAAFVPTFCRLDEATCQQLLNTDNARILGVPNFLLGLLYYAAVILYIVTPARLLFPLELVAIVSLCTVLLGLYLVYGLIYELRTHCVLCYASHACNLLIFLSLGSQMFL